LFSGIDVLQSGVAPHARTGGIFNAGFTVNLLENKTAKEFRKSVKI